jgi:lipopolysaccharide transport system permease protein
MTALGVGVLFSGMNVIYRDIRYVVPLLIQSWMFATPIVYSSNIIPKKWCFLYDLNPMARVIKGFRWTLLGEGDSPGPMLRISVGIVIIINRGVVLF